MSDFPPEKILRINELAEKARSDAGLSDLELLERDALRREYVAAFRSSLKQQLDHTYLVDEKGEKHPLPKKTH